MSELEVQFLNLLKDRQGELEKQLTMLSGQLESLKYTLGDSSDQLESYKEVQEILMERVSVLEKKMESISLPTGGQEDEGGMGNTSILSPIQKERSQKILDHVRDIISLEKRVDRSRALKKLAENPVLSLEEREFSSIHKFIDFYGRLTRAGIEERERVINKTRDDLVVQKKEREGFDM
tara:strand:- start:3974 stop:4510 length:537 start_codon:yes stop_codon:yes gene_type:complete